MSEIKVTIFGDTCFKALCAKDETLSELTTEGLENVKNNSDFLICNLECAIGNAELYDPVTKTGPNLICDVSMLRELRKIGFDGLSLANNHFGDFGKKCIDDAIEQIEQMGMKSFGAGKNIDRAYEPLRLQKDDISLSLFSVCENEFGIATADESGCAGYKEARLLSAIKLETDNGRRVIVIFHGGVENNSMPSPFVMERYHALVDIGADAVVAMHTHCPQGIERYKQGIIFYSLGNFIFPNYRKQDYFDVWNNGYGVQIEISISGFTDYTVIPNRYYLDNNRLTILDGADKDSFLLYIEKLSSFLSKPELLNRYYQCWSLKNRKHLEPFIGKNRKRNSDAELLNLFRCESHRERAITCYNLSVGKSDFDELEDAYYEVSSQVKMPYINEYGVQEWPSYVICGIEEFKAVLRVGSIYIYGVGKVASRLMEMLELDQEYDIRGFLVTDKKNDTGHDYFWGLAIYQLDQIQSEANILIAVSSKYRNEIKVLLQEKGLHSISVLDDTFVNELLVGQKRVGEKDPSALEFKTAVDEAFSSLSLEKKKSNQRSVCLDMERDKERAGYIISKIASIPQYEIILNNGFGFKNYLDAGINYRDLGKYSLPYDCYPLCSFFENNVNYAKCVFDIGANIGIMSCFFSYRAEQVYSFESSEEAALKANKNIEINGINNIIWESAEVIDEISGNSKQVTTLDDYCLGNGITSIDVLEILVGECTNKAIIGCHELLQRNRISIIALEHSLGLKLDNQDISMTYHKLHTEYGFDFYDIHLSSLSLEDLLSSYTNMDIIAINHKTIKKAINNNRIVVSSTLKKMLDCARV